MKELPHPRLVYSALKRAWAPASTTHWQVPKQPIPPTQGRPLAKRACNFPSPSSGPPEVKNWPRPDCLGVWRSFRQRCFGFLDSPTVGCSTRSETLRTPSRLRWLSRWSEKRTIERLQALARLGVPRWWEQLVSLWACRPERRRRRLGRKSLSRWASKERKSLLGRSRGA